MANTTCFVRAAQLKELHEPKELLSLSKLRFLKGLARGAITEITGPRSSGRTSLALYILAQATQAGEVCAVVDLNNNFHPESAALAGVRLEQLIWVRCGGNAEHAIRAADLLLHAGGFGVVLLDLSEATPRVLNRLPISYWYRFRQAVEHTPTVFLVCATSSQCKSSSTKRIELKVKAFHWTGAAPFLLLRGIESEANLHKARAIQPQILSLVA
ncbi:MAG: hypothetical protein JO097_16365 [Acidobacteriaceae bacterium]|nr:hypothetical protein [Acidobacteriaceae bacterium]MBV9294627.1 hypothetical protein [Acidobacteriaceae bacterium]